MKWFIHCALDIPHENSPQSSGHDSNTFEFALSNITSAEENVHFANCYHLILVCVIHIQAQNSNCVYPKQNKK